LINALVFTPLSINWNAKNYILDRGAKSVLFRGFDDDLINAEHWNKDKDAILHEIGAPMLLAPIQETLADLQKELEAKYKSVNRRIDNGDNKYIKVTGSGDKRHNLHCHLPPLESMSETVRFRTVGCCDTAPLFWLANIIVLVL
jgi:hypothetical protein